MKKRWLATSAMLAILIFLAAPVAWLMSRPSVTKDNFDRIEDGMTKGEVEEILGRKNCSMIPKEESRLLVRKVRTRLA